MFWDKYRPKISRTLISAILISFIQIIPSVVFAPSAHAVCSNPNFTAVTNWQTLLGPNGTITLRKVAARSFISMGMRYVKCRGIGTGSNTSANLVMRSCEFIPESYFKVFHILLNKLF